MTNQATGGTDETMEPFVLPGTRAKGPALAMLYVAVGLGGIFAILSGIEATGSLSSTEPLLAELRMIRGALVLLIGGKMINWAVGNMKAHRSAVGPDVAAKNRPPV